MKTRLLVIIMAIIVFVLISFAMPNLSKVYGSCEMTQAGTLQFAVGYQWTNGLFYIDNAECTWKLFGVIPIASLLSEEETITENAEEHDGGYSLPFDINQQVIERLKQKPQTVGTLDAQYIESLALQDHMVANFVERVDWKSHCCGFSENDDRIELSIVFLDESNDRQLAVTIDMDTLKIIDTDNKKTVYIGGPGRTDYPYQQISIKEAPNRSHYYHKISSLDEIQYLSEIYENGTKTITTNEFQKFYDALSKRCIENNLENADLCENTKLAFEYDSKEYRFVNQGVENEY